MRGFTGVIEDEFVLASGPSGQAYSKVGMIEGPADEAGRRCVRWGHGEDAAQPLVGRKG